MIDALCDHRWMLKRVPDRGGEWMWRPSEAGARYNSIILPMQPRPLPDKNLNQGPARLTSRPGTGIRFSIPG